MKAVKKILSVFLVVALFCSLGVVSAAAASNTTSGAITVENATVGKTYAAYKVLGATVGENGEVAYTIEEASPWYDIVDGSGLFVLNEIPGLSTENNKVYSVVRADSATDDAIIELFNDQFTYDADTATWTCSVDDADPADTQTAANSTVTLAVPYGYYLITSTLGSLVTVDTNNPTATVIDKNQGPSWDNTPDSPPEGTDPNPGKVILENGEKKTVNSASYGDSVAFDIGVNATNYVGTEQVTYYYIKDEIDDGFHYDLTGTPAAFKPVVKVGDTTLTEGDGYTVTVDGNSFEVIVKWANITLDENGAITAITSRYAANAEIHVQYSATVDAEGEDVVIGGVGNKNTANFTYNTNNLGDVPPTDPDDPDDPVPPTTPREPYDESKEKSTTTYVYALGFQKVDDNYNKLSVAEFSTAPLYVVKESDGVYKLCSADTENATQTVATDTNGQIVIKGVKAGEYSFTETKAPEGYNLLTNSFTVTATLTASYTNKTIVTYYFDENGNLADKVEDADETKTITYATGEVPVFGTGIVNHSGTELPSTGGMGTTLFYVIGSILMLGAAIVMVTKKKMSVGNN